jgi:hypothetical protein
MAAIRPAAPPPDTVPIETAHWRGAMSASGASIWARERLQWVVRRQPGARTGRPTADGHIGRQKSHRSMLHSYFLAQKSVPFAPRREP